LFRLEKIDIEEAKEREEVLEGKDEGINSNFISKGCRTPERKKETLWITVKKSNYLRSPFSYFL